MVVTASVSRTGGLVKEPGCLGTGWGSQRPSTSSHWSAWRGGGAARVWGGVGRGCAGVGAPAGGEGVGRGVGGAAGRGEPGQLIVAAAAPVGDDEADQPDPL